MGPMSEYTSLGSPSGLRGRSTVCVLRSWEGPGVGVEGFGSCKTLLTSDADGPTIVESCCAEERTRKELMNSVRSPTRGSRWWLKDKGKALESMSLN